MPFSYLRFSAKYLDGKRRKMILNYGSYDENIEYSKKLVELLRYYLNKGYILAYTVDLVTFTRNGEQIEVIATEI